MSSPATDSATASDATHRPLLADLVMLTKPRIISLLLVTAVMPMYAAGTPSWSAVIAVLVGGYLMAGGANAVNMYLDRDIDQVMARTRTRPIPAGRMAPVAVLAFGVACATAAAFILGRAVNAVSAVFALGGFYFYVFVYTRWLKRSTPQNIVIGGAAGAFPPLVGWSAVTGTIDLSAILLFLIVFYWTPPHFWALALNKQVDYGRAGVPMAPNVWGDRATITQMLWYSVLLVALTVLPACIGVFGLTYLASALVLGAIFLHGAWRVWRERDTGAWSAPAWKLYKYSLLYLALLFVAMAVDRHL
ncbi:MAG: protoheme IX farnesyltransferase [Gemmatimonadetes bacterium]|nr:protoheme IX farnesyltransferase [Gemmatimonadota bacterium]